MPYRTPSAAFPSTSPTCTITLTVPDENQTIAALYGALLELTYPWNFEQINPTHRTPTEQASVFSDVLDSYTKDCT